MIFDKTVSTYKIIHRLKRLLIELPLTIWLTAVKYESLSFFQRNKDPRAYIGKFWDLVRIRKIVWILVNGSYFFRFLPQGSAIWLNMPKNGVFSTFWYKAFSVEMPETSFSEYNKPKGWWTSNGKYFFEFRPDWL